MPIDVLTNADNTRIAGSVTIVNDPYGNSGNLNVAGTHVVSGTASFASGVTISSMSAGSIVGIGSIQGAYAYDVITGGLPATTTSSQSLSTGSQINMTSGIVSGSGIHVVYVSAASTTATVALTPTSSANTSGLFQNGMEVVVINLAASGSNVLIPTSSAGIAQQNAVTISAGCAAQFKYVAALQTWVPYMV
jgi:hypothetical protein